MAEVSIDEKLWDAAQIFAEENKTEHAAAVIQSIAIHTVGRYSGKPVEEVVFNPISKKEFNIEELVFLKELSKEVSLLLEKCDYEKAQEKALEYLDGIISLLASGYEEKQRFRKFYLKNLINIGKTQREKSLSNSRPYKLSYEQPLLKPKWVAVSGGADFSYSVATIVETYTTSEAAEILNVSDQTIRRMCDAGKYPGASRTDGGHWRIPKNHFQVTLEQSKQIYKNLADIRRKSDEGGQVDEFDL